MERIGIHIQKLRLEKNFTLQHVASFLDIKVDVLRKIEDGEFNLDRSQVDKLSSYFKVSNNELLVSWLSDQLFYVVEHEETGMEALQVAEEKVAYRSFKKIDRNKLISDIVQSIDKFPSIEKAWIYGSFSRGDDGPKSDIDIALKTSISFSYFDLAEVQFQLEQFVHRKIDVGFIDSFKPYIFDHVKPDLKLIYERPNT